VGAARKPVTQQRLTTPYQGYVRMRRDGFSRSGEFLALAEALHVIRADRFQNAQLGGCSHLQRIFLPGCLNTS